jgi:hypothetical protein
MPTGWSEAEGAVAIPQSSPSISSLLAGAERIGQDLEVARGVQPRLAPSCQDPIFLLVHVNSFSTDFVVHCWTVVQPLDTTLLHGQSAEQKLPPRTFTSSLMLQGCCRTIVALFKSNDSVTV